jgi:hypothetical protein
MALDDQIQLVLLTNFILEDGLTCKIHRHLTTNSLVCPGRGIIHYFRGEILPAAPPSHAKGFLSARQYPASAVAVVRYTVEGA